MTRRTFDRRQAILGMGATIMASNAGRAFANEGDFATRLAQLQRDGRVFGLHALLVSRGGRLLFEHYETAEDEMWGQPLGKVAFGPTVLHDLRSVSKSIVGPLYGIALAGGKVPEPQARLYDQFPEYADLAGQPGRDRITISHVLSMTMGTEWDELTFVYSDPRNSETAMEAASDRYRYVLACPVVEPPGMKWTYNGGATALVGRLIARGTGERLHDYARRVLFDPMGLGPTEWIQGRDSEPRAASGLRMRPTDLLRIGEMVLAKGVWQGKQVVPAKWLEQSRTQAVAIDGPFGYGWHWYLGSLQVGLPPRTVRSTGAAGWGGQRLYVVPDNDLVIAINAGNYWRSLADQRRVVDALVKELILPLVS
jgi:CubicO group peptidase (beta-lactamase class C family)